MQMHFSKSFQFRSSYFNSDSIILLIHWPVYYDIVWGKSINALILDIKSNIGAINKVFYDRVNDQSII